VSLALFAGNVLLLWWVLRMLSLRWAWLATLLFALHPLQVETVAWISEQKNLLALLFALLTAGTFLRSRDAVAPWSRRAGYGLALVLFVLAMLSKAVVVPLPVALLLILWWRHGVLRWRDAAAVLPLLGVGLALSALFAWVNLDLHSQGSDLAFTGMQRLLIAGHALGFYAGKFLWPMELLAMYSRWSAPGAGLDYFYPAVVLVVLPLLFFRRHAWGRGPVTGLLLFILLLSPALGLVNFSYLRFSFVADHFTYLAVPALCVLSAEGLRVLAQRMAGAAPHAVGPLVRRYPQAACAAVLLLVLLPLTWGYACVRQNMIATWRDTVDHNSSSWMARAVLACAYLEAGNNDLALQEARQSLTLMENGAALEVAAAALLREGRTAESVRFYERLMAADLALPCDLIQYGRQEIILGHPDKAAVAFQAALRLNPALDDVWDELTICHLRQKHWADAADVARAALALRETRPSAHHNLAWALEHLGCVDGPDGALAHYRRALALDPAQKLSSLQLGRCLEQQGRKAEALAQYRQTVGAFPDYAEAHAALDGLLSELGHTSATQKERQRSVPLPASRPD